MIAVSIQQRMMPILATETVASACAIPELMVACKAIGKKQFSLNIR